MLLKRLAAVLAEAGDGQARFQRITALIATSMNTDMGAIQPRRAGRGRAGPGLPALARRSGPAICANEGEGPPSPARHSVGHMPPSRLTAVPVM